MGAASEAAGMAVFITPGYIYSGMQDWRYDVDDVASGLQEFLICVEMFFAALAHAHAFPPRDYMDPANAPPRSFRRSLRIMFDVRDVRDDMVEFSTDTASGPGHDHHVCLGLRVHASGIR